MSFRFNFSSEDQNLEEKASEVEEIKWLESEEVTPNKQMALIDEIAVHAKMFVCGDAEIGYVVANEAISKLSGNETSNIIELADKEHSDLVTGKYEGGLKIWECTYDLIEYFEEKEDKIDLKNKKVLDLGCGPGILGIYVFMNGSNVTFQDYNKEVLECITIPNVILNIEEEDRETEIKRCNFYSGDWASFNSNLPDSEVYDIIVTSETIYNQSNYEKLIALFLRRLSGNGTIYVAAKNYYFGVGGGTRQFESSIDKNGLLKSEVCWKSSGGIQREILKITRK